MNAFREQTVYISSLSNVKLWREGSLDLPSHAWKYLNRFVTPCLESIWASRKYFQSFAGTFRLADGFAGVASANQPTSRDLQGNLDWLRLSSQTWNYPIMRGECYAGKIAVVTGGSSGIGLETVRVLALAGAQVYIGSPSTKKADAAIALLK
jgi:hypothetical protein